MSTDPIPKYLEIARLIEARSVTGRASAEKMPSSREVAGRYGVSIVTASRALQVLRDKGLIRIVDRAGSYIAPAPSGPKVATGERWALVLRCTPGPWLQASLSFARSGFDAIARREGVRFDLDLFDLDGTARSIDLRRDARRAAGEGVAGVIFMPSRLNDEMMRRDEAFVDACREAALPVVLIERNLRGAGRALEHDLVSADDHDGGRRCTEHLLGLGRRKVAFAAGSPTSSHEGRLSGYLAGLQAAKAACTPLVLEQSPEQGTRDACADLADRLLAEGADAVVCYQDYTALGLILELLTRGLQVPRHVAITGFDNLPIGKAFAIGVTTYAFPIEAVAAHALRHLRARLSDPSGPPVKTLIPGELIVRESSAVAATT